MCTVRTRNNGNRFIEQYEWTIGMSITVQIGEGGNFTDVHIGERGKQRVNYAQTFYSGYKSQPLLPIFLFIPTSHTQKTFAKPTNINDKFFMFFFFFTVFRSEQQVPPLQQPLGACQQL